jgi:hypothetical protein
MVRCLLTVPWTKILYEVTHNKEVKLIILVKLTKEVKLIILVKLTKDDVVLIGVHFILMDTWILRILSVKRIEGIYLVVITNHSYLTWLEV